MADPTREKLRNDKAEPMSTPSSTDMVDPKRVLLKTENADPKRPNDRRDSEDPRCRKSRTDIADPKRVMLRTESEELK